MRVAAMMLLLVLFLGLLGCTMFGNWRTVPPPGGCDQCHTLAISTDWRVALTPVAVTDWKVPLFCQASRPLSSVTAPVLQEQHVIEERCFRCHHSPDGAHAEYRGRYHH